MLFARANVCCALLLLLSSGSIAGERLPVVGGELSLTWNGHYSSTEKDKLRRWLAGAAATTSTLYQRLPRMPLYITLNRADSAAEPVPFGQVHRGARQGVNFWVNPDFPIEDFLEDWTAVHEIVHLTINYPGDKDLWLSEGLASYYQNVLRARSGVLNEQQSWQKMYNGFMRGRQDNRYDHYDLETISLKIHETRSYMRVYWSGAAFFLEADLLLRQHNQQQSLDSVLGDYQACCLQPTGFTKGVELLQQLDRLAGWPVFIPLYEKYRQLYHQPDPMPLLTQLGISLDEDRIVLSSADESVLRMRQSIMAGRE